MARANVERTRSIPHLQENSFVGRFRLPRRIGVSPEVSQARPSESCLNIVVRRVPTVAAHLRKQACTWRTEFGTARSFGKASFLSHQLSRLQRESRAVVSASLFGGAASSSMESKDSKDPISSWLCSEQGGGATKVTKTSPIFGGCINSAYRYDTDKGPFFVKVNRGANAAMFEAEMLGLQAMYDTHTIRVPRPYIAGSLPGRGSFIIMEFVEFGAASGGQRELGRQLALMHKQSDSDKGFGFDVNNTIGSTPQVNPWTADWATFFGDHRLGFQLDLIRKEYRDTELCRLGEQLIAQVPRLLGGLDVKPCLLHGDLWSGNIAADSSGQPVILDPATYYGHHEAEFGMSWCASFGPAFYSAYFEVMPKEAGFEERVELYKLYHYLNHYNLFGSSYRSSCMSIIKRFI